MVWSRSLCFGMLMWGKAQFTLQWQLVHSDIVSSRRFALFPLFDCLPFGRQLTLFGQPSLEFETGRIGHGGPFLGWHGDIIVTWWPFLDRYGAEMVTWWTLFRSACRDFSPVLSLSNLSTCLTPSYITENQMVHKTDLSQNSKSEHFKIQYSVA